MPQGTWLQTLSSHHTALSFWVRSTIIVIVPLFCALALQATKKIIIKIFKVSFENFLEEVSILSIHPLKTSWFCLPSTSLFFFFKNFFLSPLFLLADLQRLTHKVCLNFRKLKLKRSMHSCHLGLL